MTGKADPVRELRLLEKTQYTRKAEEEADSSKISLVS